jgi:hypothetical protein
MDLVYHVLRALGLAVVGYIGFALPVALYRAMTDAVVVWPAGALLALAFASSEFLNTGRGRAAGIVRRIGIACVIMLVGGLCGIWLSDVFGWRATYDLQREMQFWQAGVIVAFYAVGMSIAWLVWIPHHRPTEIEGK